MSKDAFPFTSPGAAAELAALGFASPALVSQPGGHFPPGGKAFGSFPIPVVAVGPGSQTDDAPEYLPMPQGMDTFAAPRLPEQVEPEVLAQVVDVLADFTAALAATPFEAAATVRRDLFGLPPRVREILGDVLGFGEVSAFTVAPEHWRIQETAFAGVWRVLRLAPHRDGQQDGQQEVIVEDRVEAGAIPAMLAATMLANSRRELAAPSYPLGTMNAEALVQELQQQAARYQPGSPAHVINLTLLPVSDADLDTLYGWLGHREVSILSRGYGNCRITSTRLANVWWVQYFNTMDTLILNTLEVVDMPEVALAAAEDYQDSMERLGEYLLSLREDLEAPGV